VIRLNEVLKVYRRGAREVRALDGVSLGVAAGEFVAVTGASGSGKSTLLHLVGALDSASAGDVVVGGASLAALDDRALTAIRRKQIGFVFQFFNLLPSMSARENVMLPALLEGVAAAEAGASADRLLERVGLAGRGEHRPDELSGGEMQRVAIARALVKGAPLLLCDEPTGNLDSATGAEILALLGDLRRDGATILMVTHDPAAARAAGAVIELRDGRVVADSRAPVASVTAR
jgi:putative ABC transport system ATP-binding protein